MSNGFFASLFGGSSKKQDSSASIAADRLRVIVQSDHRLSRRLTAENIDKMKREILAIVNRYVNGVSMEDVELKQRSDAHADILEMNVNLPDEHASTHRQI